MTDFRPPVNWEEIYAADPDGYTFGEEPSQLARSAMAFFRAFGGVCETARALDLGCGEGRDTVFLAGAGMHVTARDVSPTGLEKLERLRVKQNVPGERIDAALGDVRDFAYPADAYDLTLAANVFQFLTPDEAPGHIQRLQAATKPGGICAVGVFHPAMKAWGVDIEGRFSATADELRALFGDGWQLLDRTEYWIYRREREQMLSFAYVVARRLSEENG